MVAVTTRDIHPRVLIFLAHKEAKVASHGFNSVGPGL